MRTTPIHGLLILTALLCLAGVAASAGQNTPVPPAKSAAPSAALSPAEMEKLSGKDLYKAACKRCHGKDAKAGEYTPMTLIQEQWERFFDEKFVPTHKAVADSLHDGRPVPEWITPRMIEKLRKFTIEGAADSEHPMTCG